MDLQVFIGFLEFNFLVDYLVGLYLLMFLVQLFYLLFFFARLAFYKSKPFKGMYKGVSVIICARNERENLLSFLPDYFLQDYPEYEVIVVNDSSLDDTEDVLKAFALQHKNLKIVNVPDNDRFFGSKKFALTLGIKAAQYENVLLTDADCRPRSKNWIKRMSSYQGKEKIILGYGGYFKEKGILNKLIQYETFFTALQYLSFALAKMPYMGVGRNLAYKSELFFKNKGFASHQHILSGDDDLFINEVANGSNTKIEIDSDAQTMSKPKGCFKDWYRQKRRHLSTGTKYKLKHKFALGLFQLSQFLFILLFIVLVLQVRPVYLIVAVYLFRYLIQMLIFKLSSNKIGGSGVIFLAPLFEVFFMVFNIYIVVINSISKKIKWN